MLQILQKHYKKQQKVTKMKLFCNGKNRLKKV